MGRREDYDDLQQAWTAAANQRSELIGENRRLAKELATLREERDLLKAIEDAIDGFCVDHCCGTTCEECAVFAARETYAAWQRKQTDNKDKE